MKAITNVLHPSFRRGAIDSDFDFFHIKTEQKYFPKGARVLDVRQENLEFRSLVFENGRSIYCFCKKGKVSRLDLIEAINDNTITIKNVSSFELEDRVLLKLFLYSLNCPSEEGVGFNNLAGKLYVYLEGLNSTSKALKVLSFDIDKEMGLQISATCFTPTSQFPKDKIKDDPKYVFSHEHLSFKRCYGPIDGETLYVRKTRFGKKTEVPFLKFNKSEKVLTKAYWAYKALSWVAEEYSPYVDLGLKEADIIGKVTTRRDIDFVEKAISTISAFQCVIVNLAGDENSEKLETLKLVLEKKLGTNINVSPSICPGCINFCLIHNKEYYERWNAADPQKTFPSNVVVQCIALEDGFIKVAKEKEAVIDTVIKEAAIKTDIIHNRAISLDSWASFGHESDWTFITNYNNWFYAMIIHPDGSFDFKTAKDNFVAFTDRALNTLSSLISGQSDSAQTVVKDSAENICLITGTSIYSLPDKGIFASSVSRSKESRDKYLAGVVDINLLSFDNRRFYNAGIVGAGMNTDVPKAAPYYEISVVSGVDIMEELLESMSVMFVKFKSFTVFPYPFKYLREFIELKTLQSSNGSAE